MDATSLLIIPLSISNLRIQNFSRFSFQLVFQGGGRKRLSATIKQREKKERKSLFPLQTSDIFLANIFQNEKKVN